MLLNKGADRNVTYALLNVKLALKQSHTENYRKKGKTFWDRTVWYGIMVSLV